MRPAQPPPYPCCPACRYVTAPLSYAWRPTDDGQISWRHDIDIVCGNCEHRHHRERVVADRLLDGLLGRRREEVTIAGQATAIAERMLARMEAELHRIEANLDPAEQTISGLRGELGEARTEVVRLRGEVADKTLVQADRDRLVGSRRALAAAVRTVGADRRHTALNHRLSI